MTDLAIPWPRAAQDSPFRRLGLVLLAACDGAVRGTVLGMFALIAVEIGGLLLATPWLVAVDRWPGAEGPVLLLPSFLLATPVAYFSAASAADELASMSGDGRQARLMAAVAGALALAFLDLFVVRTAVPPVALAADAIAIASWVVGTGAGGRPRAARRRGRLLLVGTLVVAAALFAVLVAVTSIRQAVSDGKSRDLSAIGTVPPSDALRPIGWDVQVSGGTFKGTIVAGDEGVAWSDARLELWAAVPLDGGPFADDRVGGPDPAFTAPLRALPVQPGQQVTMRLDDVRGVSTELVALTYVLDGHRMVATSMAVAVEYRATIGEWLASYMTPSGALVP